MAISEELVDTLNRLSRLSQNAADTYQRAIGRLSEDDLASSLRIYRDEHRDHVQQLARLLGSYGVQAAPAVPSQGLSLPNVVTLPALVHMEDVLAALRDDEGIVNDRYREALDAADLPDEVLQTLEKQRERNARHLQWLNHAIDGRIWDTNIETTTGVSPVRPTR